MQDAELLRDYVTCGSEPAFAELVDHYVDFVYSTARRQIGNAQLAEEVAQSCFPFWRARLSDLWICLLWRLALPGYLLHRRENLANGKAPAASRTGGGHHDSQ